VFDVAINGQTVLPKLDIFAAASGKDIAIDYTFTVPVVNGVVTISAPIAEADNAEFQAVKVVAGNVTKAYLFLDHALQGHPRTNLAAVHCVADDYD
jgi:hypothetical protein